MADPPRKRMSAVQRRGELLDAASEVFGRRGYHGASLDEIASTAGVSKALIYEHFTSKRELHAELVEQHAGEIFRRLQANTEAGASGEERLRGGIEAFLGFVEENRDAWRALFRDASDPEVTEAISRVREQAAGVVGALMAATSRASLASARSSALSSSRCRASCWPERSRCSRIWWTDHRDPARDRRRPRDGLLLDRPGPRLAGRALPARQARPLMLSRR